jgi:hypothetical protein
MRHAFRSFVLGIFVGLAIVGSCSAENKITSGGLIGHWTFAEGAGDIVGDSSGEGNHGTIVPTNTPKSNWGIGDFAGSLSFKGGDHFVRVPASASLNNLKRQITVTALIYPRTLWTPIDRYISFAQRKWNTMVRWVERTLGMAGRAQSSPATGFIAIVQRQWRETIHPDQFYLGYGLENHALHYKWHVGLMDDELSLYRLPEGQVEPKVGEWVHLAGTYDGATGKMSLYVDGELIGSQTRIGEIRLDPESLNRPLAIGAELNGSSTDEATGEFDGYIRDVRVYDRAVSDQDVKSLAEEAKRLVRK